MIWIPPRRCFNIYVVFMCHLAVKKALKGLYTGSSKRSRRRYTVPCSSWDEIHASKMKTIRTTEEELEKVARQFKEREDVVAIYVFGSFVTRRKRPEDIDVCVITRRRLDLERELELAARFPDDVDVIFFYRLPVKVRFNVFRQGRPLLVNDEDALLEVKARTVRQHQDSYSWIQRYRLRWFK